MKKLIALSTVLVMAIIIANPSSAVHDNARLISTESLYDKCVPDSCGLFWSKPQKYYVTKKIYSRPDGGTNTVIKTEHAGFGNCG